MNYAIFLIFFKFTVTLATECLRRDYGYGSTVCVCNNQHCDTIPPIKSLDPSSYIVFTSNKDGLRFESSKNVFEQTPLENKKEYSYEYTLEKQKLKDYETCENKFGKKAKYKKSYKIKKVADKKIVVDQNIKYQSVLGWGAAFTDASGINIKKLNSQLQDVLLRSYFSTDGLEYSLGRVPIGCTDFSTRGYTYVDTENDGDYCEDPLLTKFKLAVEDRLFKIPLIKKAQDLNNNLLLFGATWTAPKWMKENKQYMGTMGYLKTKMYRPWANYMIKFLDAYKSHNISFWGITTGNEVYFSMALENVPGDLWAPVDMGKWIRLYLGPAIRNSSYSDIKILTHDDNRPILLHSLDTVLLSEPVNHDYIDGVAIHYYFDNESNAYILDEVHGKYPNKILLYTEASTGVSGLDSNSEPVNLGSWERAEKYARNILEDMNHWVVGWTDWNMALDLNGGPTYTKNFLDAPIIVNATAQEFYKQPMYYALGHFSKFIPRDSVRIYSSQLDADVQVVAFKRPDGAVVIVILNKMDNIQSRTILDSIKGQIQLKLSPHSISTILYW